MRNTIPIGRIFGIRVGISRFIPWLLLGFLVYSSLADEGAEVLATLLVVVMLFGLVLLHELGHSLVARRFGIQVQEITLSPLGGAAWMEEIPEDPRIEACVAVAGPAVNLVLALLATPFLFVESAVPVASVFIFANLLLGLFNLIPAFPMDGGRVLRAWLARKNDWLTATEKAVRFGRSLLLFGSLIALFRGYPIVLVLALYVAFLGQRELFALRARKLGTAFPFGAFADVARRAQAQYATRANGAAAGQTSANFEGVAQDSAPGETTRSASTQRQATGISRPNAGEKRGFTEADIAKLESFRGRLKRDWKQGEN